MEIPLLSSQPCAAWPLDWYPAGKVRLDFSPDDRRAGPGMGVSAARILLVEDDLMIGQMYLLGLSSAGYEVTLATDGIEALDKMRSTRPDLVLLDIRLPNMDGLEVLAVVREDAELSRTPVVVLSNFGEQDTIQKARSLGAVDYLNKSSVSPGELARRLPSWFEKA